MQSLLGQFYNRIKGSQEDIASESLVYILNSSSKATNEFLRIIEKYTGINITQINFSTQSVGENQERPDISGRNNEGKEVIIVECKFWSSLTSNQPNEYLKRLKKDSVLVFLVPSLRVRTVFEEVDRKLVDQINNFDKDIENNKIVFKENNIQIIVLSWNDILKPLRSELLIEGNSSDIDQLIGFCESIDNDAFLPITDTDLSPIHAKRMMSYYDLADKVVEELIKEVPEVSTEGLIKTPKRYGYRRYFSINNFGLAIGFRMEHWSEYADTPFWFHIADMGENRGWNTPEELQIKCQEIARRKGIKYVLSYGEIGLALYPLVDKTEDIVINDLVKQVKGIIEEIIIN